MLLLKVLVVIMSYELTIKVGIRPEVHQALRDKKQRGESFNDVIKRLLEESKEPVGEVRDNTASTM